MNKLLAKALIIEYHVDKKDKGEVNEQAYTIIIEKKFRE
jgi:hypothetical protein